MCICVHLHVIPLSIAVFHIDSRFKYFVRDLCQCHVCKRPAAGLPWEQHGASGRMTPLISDWGLESAKQLCSIMALSACVWFTVGMCTSNKSAGARHGFFSCTCMCPWLAIFWSVILRVCQLYVCLLWPMVNSHSLTLSVLFFGSLWNFSSQIHSWTALYAGEYQQPPPFEETSVWNSTISCLRLWCGLYCVIKRRRLGHCISHIQLFSGHFSRRQSLQTQTPFFLLLLHWKYWSLSLSFFFTTTKIHHRTWRWNSKICCFFFTHHAFSTILYIVGVGVCVAAEEYSKWLLESLLVLEPSSSATFRQTCSTQTKRYTVWIYCDLLCGC